MLETDTGKEMTASCYRVVKYLQNDKCDMVRMIAKCAVQHAEAFGDGAGAFILALAQALRSFLHAMEVHAYRASKLLLHLGRFIFVDCPQVLLPSLMEQVFDCQQV